MARQFLTPINLNVNELQNAVIGNLITTDIDALSGAANLVKGRIVFDSTLNVVKYWDGSGWQKVASGGTGFTLGSTAVTLGGGPYTTINNLTLGGTSTWNGNAIAVDKGGTNLTSYTAGDLLYASGTTTIAKLGIGTTDKILTSTGSAPQWVTSLTIAQGGTGSTTGSITGSGTLTFTAGAGNNSINLRPTGTGSVNLGSTDGTDGFRITGLATPQNDYEAANKYYVDTVAAGLNAHDAVQVATTAALGTTGNLVGGTITTTYANGTSGVGATITIASSANWTNTAVDGIQLSGVITAVTASSPSAGFATYSTTTPPVVGQTVKISGASVAGYNATAVVTAVSAGTSFTIANSTTGAATFTSGAFISQDRILIKDQSSKLQNGIYVVTSGGNTSNSTQFVFTRAADSNSTPELGSGDLTYVINGTNNAGNGFVQTAVVTTIGTDVVNWSQFSGSSTTLAGAGLKPNTTNPNQIDVVSANGTLTVVADSVDLAAIAVGATTNNTSATLVKSVSTDGYGRVTSVASGSHPDASSSVKGIATFNTNSFTVTNGDVALTALNSLGITAGSTNTGTFVNYNGTTSAAGQFDGGTTLSTSITNNLNYNGIFRATQFVATGSTTNRVFTGPTEAVATTTPDVYFKGSTNSGATSGTKAGNAVLLGGTASNNTSNITAGDAIVRGGDAASNQLIAGDVRIDGGQKSGAANGVVYVGADSLRTTRIDLGNSGSTTNLYGTLAFQSGKFTTPDVINAGGGSTSTSTYLYTGKATQSGANNATSGSLYLDVGYVSSPLTATPGSIFIGTQTKDSPAANTNIYNAPAAITIGQTGVTTTINGTVKIPGLGSSGLVGLTTGGQLTQVTTTFADVSANNSFTGANTFYNTTGQTFSRTANTDGITILPANVGTAGRRITLTTPGTLLAANATITLPGVDSTLATLAGSEALTNKTYNGLTLSGLTTGFSIAGGTTSKTLTVSETMTLTAGGVGQTFTFPATSATIARTDAGQTFTGAQTIQSASTKDAVVIQGTGNGTTSKTVTLQPGGTVSAPSAALTNSSTIIIPDAGAASQTFAMARIATGTVTVAAGSGTITHNMNNQYVHVQIFDNSTNALVDMDVTLTSANVVTIASTANATYRYVIIG